MCGIRIQTGTLEIEAFFSFQATRHVQQIQWQHKLPYAGTLTLICRIHLKGHVIQSPCL